jgi:hypothetical protein
VLFGVERLDVESQARAVDKLSAAPSLAWSSPCAHETRHHEIENAHRLSVPTAPGHIHISPQCVRISLHHLRTAQTMPDTDGRTNGHPPLPFRTPTKPVPYFLPENAHAPRPQLRLDRGAGDDTDHDGDDEQEEHDPSDGPSPSRSRSRSRPHSPCAPSPTTTPQQQQQPPPTSPPPPSPCAAHVHFHSRVRITSGLRHSHANANHTLNDSSDSDSPSSSISAPLRFRSHDTGPRAPLIERVSRLAAQARQKRRAAGAAPKASRMRVNDLEYTPLFRAVVPVAYGATQGGRSGRNGADPSSEDRSRIDGLRGEDEVAFGRWPWRALNRHVSGSRFMQKR